MPNATQIHSLALSIADSDQCMRASKLQQPHRQTKAHQQRLLLPLHALSPCVQPDKNQAHSLAQH
jgi:hypothetical protein